jgi:tetratricopeptide (TPR) repeat protein
VSDVASYRRTERSRTGHELVQARGELLGYLKARFQAAGDGGMACVVSGSPGVGKTFFAEQFLRDLPAPVPRLRGRGLQTGVAPLLPICDAISSYTTGENADQLRAVAEEYVEAIPLLKVLLAPLLRARARTAHTRSSLRQVVPSETYTFVVLTRFLESLATSQTPILFIDDIQWIDAASTAFLGYLSGQLRNRRVFLLLARRLNGKDDEHVTALLETLRRDAGERTVEIALEGLTQAEEVTLLESLLGKVHFEPVDLDWLHASSQGKPYFLRELVELLRSDGRLVQNGGVWQLREQAREQLFPPSLLRQVRERIHSALAADPATLEVVQFAACLGSNFDARVVAEALGQPARRVAALLESAERNTSLLHRQGRTTRFAFEHDITREAIVAELGDFSHEVHAKLAETLSRRDEVDPAVVAYQYAASGDQRMGAEWYLRAGNQAASASLHESTLRYGTLSDRLLAEANESAGSPLRSRAAALVARGLLGAERYGDAVAFLGERLTTTDEGSRAGLRHLLGRAAARLPEESRHRQAVAELRGALTALPPGTDHQLRIDILIDLVHTYDALGDHAASQASFQAAITSAKEFGYEPALVRLMRLTCMFWQPEKVAETIEQALVRARRSGLRHEIALCENNLGTARFALGDLARARQHFEQSYGQLKQLGGYRGDVPMNNAGLVHLAQGDIPRGQEFLRGALASSHDPHCRLFIRTNMAVADAINGDLTESISQLQTLVAEADASGDLFYRDCLRHNLANALLAVGQADAAETIATACAPHHHGGDDLLVRAKRALLLIRAREIRGEEVPPDWRSEAALLDRTTKPQAWLYRLPWYLCDIEFWED